MVAETLTIVTTYDRPPGPSRNFDWEARLSNYDPENDDPRGFGPTEEDAVEDLMWKLEVPEFEAVMRGLSSPKEAK